MLILKNIAITYDQYQSTIIENLNLNVYQEQIYCLLGPSGSGKSSILRAIAGLTPISDGEIYLQDELISSAQQQKPTHQRKIGMMFQDYALFPHLNVTENIRLGLLNLSKTSQNQRIAEMLDLIELTAYAKSMPHQLSGGQQQRLALARSLAPKPLCLLLDEPFSSLDHLLRTQLGQDVRSILKHEKISAIIVTHDAQEAFAIADQIAVLEHKKIQQIDTPENLYHLPQTPYIAELMGQGAFIKGVVVCEACAANHRPALFLTPLGYLSAHKKQVLQGCVRCIHEEVKILIRPDDVILESPTSTIQENTQKTTPKTTPKTNQIANELQGAKKSMDIRQFKVQVLAKSYRGSDSLYQLKLIDIHPDWLAYQQKQEKSKHTQKNTENNTQAIELFAQAPSRQAFEIGNILQMCLDLHYLSAFSE